ncbi:hypothetical protein EYC59_06065 [Candidatus Saccharibacteria bacterium]|nr:MAG: hypothetical protein EYC59_06065 [Candidatus Saccharibacteria bacterium]
MHAILVAVVFGAIGAYLLAASKAATPTASFEAENGVLASSATTASDSTASGGNAVRFTASGQGETYTLPTAATVGPRYASTRTLSAAQALTELRSTGTLSRATIQGTFSLSGSDGINWVIEDVRFESGTYGVRGYSGGTAFTGTQAQRPVFRYVEVVGTAARNAGDCSAVVYGYDMVFEHADIYGCNDGVKASSNFEMSSSWVHDLDHPSAAHSDAVQIVSGTGIVFTGNRFDAYVGYSSDGSQVPDGDTANAALQTGSVTGQISATWEHNWFAGGHYTIRSDGANALVDYTFRNNRFLRNGTSVALEVTNLPPNRYGPVYGGVTTNEVWENNVWDDTGELVQ